MEPITYLDFDMLIEHIEGGYAVRVLSSPAGEASAKFTLPFSDLELDNIALQLGRTRRGVRRLESPEMEVARNFGRRLFEAVFGQEVRDRLRGSLGSVNQEGKGLRIRLRTAGAPELADLPWEYLYDPSLERFLLLSVQTPLVRYLEVPQPDRPLSVSPPLNVVFMISNPKEYEPLEVEREWEILKEALGGLEQRGLVSLHRLEAATLETLLRKLRTGEYHIFHYIGHGGFDRQSEDGVLVLEDGYGGSRLVSGRYLGTILHDHRPMRLAILNACEGARTSRTDPFAGVAQSLVQQGIPAVVAMQFEITDEAAITFSRELYGAMVDGYPVDAAVAEARKAIFAKGNDVEWGTPVLYLCSPDGTIFNVSPAEKFPSRSKAEEPPPDLEIEARIERLYTEGLSAFWLEEWGKASQLFQNILDLRPDYQDASNRLLEAKHQLQLKTLYDRALEAERAVNWGETLRVLEELDALAPNYRDVSIRLPAARQQSQLTELYSEARQLHQAGKWQAVISVFAKIEAVNPQYPDPENLRATAEGEVAALKSQEELETLYAHAVREIDAQGWETARQILGQLLEMQPGYRQADRLLKRAEAELSRRAADLQRQEQLHVLYEEAQNLAKTNQWPQVQSRMKEIYTLDPHYPDPVGLATRAEHEIEAEKRKVEQADKLDMLYSEAVQLVQAGKYQEALTRWGEVQTLDTNYPDNQKVYATATRRLKEAARPPKTVVAQEALPAQRTEWAIVAVSYSWLLVGLIVVSIFRSIDPDFTDLYHPLYLMLLTILGVLVGGGLWAGLRVARLPLYWFHLIALSLGWAAGFTLYSLVAKQNLFLGDALGGAVGGLITGLVIYRAMPEFPKARIGMITLGWVTSLLLSEFVIQTLWEEIPVIAAALNLGIAGLIGSWVTFEAIRNGPIRRPSWRLVLASALGFIIGMVGADVILLKYPPLIPILLALALWGFLGGAALSTPSRDSRKIVGLGLVSALGMLVGVLIWYTWGGFQDSISWHLDDLHWHSDINLFLGLGLGLAFGFSTRRITAVLILPLVGVAAFMFATWIYQNWDYGVWWLGDIAGGAIIGELLALAWGYLEKPIREDTGHLPTK